MTTPEQYRQQCAAIARAVAARVAAEHAALERAAEAALQAGDRGVLALTDLAGAVLSASADERVPYGQLWYVPASLDVDELVRLRRLAGDPTPTRPLQSAPPPVSYLDARRDLSKQPPEQGD